MLLGYLFNAPNKRYHSGSYLPRVVRATPTFQGFTKENGLINKGSSLYYVPWTGGTRVQSDKRPLVDYSPKRCTYGPGPVPRDGPVSVSEETRDPTEIGDEPVNRRSTESPQYTGGDESLEVYLNSANTRKTV